MANTDVRWIKVMFDKLREQLLVGQHNVTSQLQKVLAGRRWLSDSGLGASAGATRGQRLLLGTYQTLKSRRKLWQRRVLELESAQSSSESSRAKWFNGVLIK